jgi:ubiquinone/menaquinone biosynthesis C-methylase UbiE
VYEAFSDFHTGLNRDLDQQLSGGSGRYDVVEKGGVIARLSHAMEPLAHEALTGEVEQRPAGRVLDVGCGTAGHLVHVLQHAPAATGVGAELDVIYYLPQDERAGDPLFAVAATSP